jgi:TRAP-type C4-dicarboxylate transport system permease small subunit
MTPSNNTRHPSVKVLAALIKISANIAGLGILAMIAITCLDVILRRLGSSVPGAYDLVRLAGGVTIAASLPLTTAVKGHVAIEYFFHRLAKKGRIIVDSLMRLLQLSGFIIASWAFAIKGINLFKEGEVTPTLQIPVFWLSWLVALMSLITAVITLYHLIRPGKELLKQ